MRCASFKVLLWRHNHKFVIMFTPPALRSIFALVADSDVSGRVYELGSWEVPPKWCECLWCCTIWWWFSWWSKWWWELDFGGLTAAHDVTVSVPLNLPPRAVSIMDSESAGDKRASLCRFIFSTSKSFSDDSSSSVVRDEFADDVIATFSLHRCWFEDDDVTGCRPNWSCWQESVS